LLGRSHLHLFEQPASGTDGKRPEKVEPHRRSTSFSSLLMRDRDDTLLARLRDPRAIPILARHSIPVIGVFVLSWSVLETVAALFLDALSTLWLVGAMAAYFAAKQFDYGEDGVLHALHFWAGVFGIFVFGAGILTFTVGVPAFMLLPLVESAHVDPRTLLTSGWLPRAFGFMLLCQLPSFVQRVRLLEATGLAPEKMGLDGETGFVLHRTVLLAALGSMLAILGPYALPVLVVLAQAVGAGSEIMRDRYIGYLMASRTPAGATEARPVSARPIAGSKFRRRRKRR
jgi:hypothetical protein